MRRSSARFANLQLYQTALSRLNLRHDKRSGFCVVKYACRLTEGLSVCLGVSVSVLGRGMQT